LIRLEALYKLVYNTLLIVNYLCDKAIELLTK